MDWKEHQLDLLSGKKRGSEVMQAVNLTFAAIIAYMLGSVNTSIIVGKIKGIDIRQHGSGNAGATNTLRTLGKSSAVMVLVGDILKGVLGVLIGMYLDPEFGKYVAGVAAVLGHNYPVFFGFKGGKGILTSAAVIFMIDWKMGLTLLAIALAIMAVTRYVSLGSVVGSLLFPIIVVVFYKGQNTFYQYLTFATIIAVLAIYRHKANIQRLMNGTESKLGSKNKETVKK